MMLRDTEHTLMSAGVGLATVASSAGDWATKFAFAVAVAVATRFLTLVVEAAWSAARRPRKPPNSTTRH